MLLVDTSASMTLNLDLARAAAEQVVIRMMPGDRARVGSFSDRIDLSGAFTSDRDALLANLRDLHFGNSTKLWDAVQETMSDLSPLGGRRVIILLSDGMDTISTARESDILARAREEEIMVYVVQFRSNLQANLAEVPLSPSPGALFAGDPRLRNPPPTEALRRLATQTGGLHFMLRQQDDVNATFTHVMEELHNQYVLGFTPAETRRQIARTGGPRRPPERPRTRTPGLPGARTGQHVALADFRRVRAGCRVGPVPGSVSWCGFFRLPAAASCSPPRFCSSPGVPSRPWPSRQWPTRSPRAATSSRATTTRNSCATRCRSR